MRWVDTVATPTRFSSPGLVDDSLVATVSFVFRLGLMAVADASPRFAPKDLLAIFMFWTGFSFI
jgi:hypothetical protein